MNENITNYDEKYLKIVRKKLLELSAGTSAIVFLFGSRANGKYRQGSDIDVGFENISKEEFRKISLQFGIFWEDCIVPNKVDLVYFPDMNEGFIEEAKKDTIIWKAG